jgi:hypothetical protein
MKLAFLALTALVITSSAHALSVGDSATYTVTPATGASETLVETVTSISGDTYTISNSVNGVAQPDQTGSVAEINQMLAAYPNCTQYSGQFSSVTVGAGTFNTCEISQNGESLYFSPDVAFVIVKLVTTDNGGGTVTLDSFITK